MLDEVVELEEEVVAGTVGTEGGVLVGANSFDVGVPDPPPFAPVPAGGVDCKLDPEELDPDEPLPEPGPDELDPEPELDEPEPEEPDPDEPDEVEFVMVNVGLALPESPNKTIM